jgi:GT2 family glycosyltransferase
MNDGFQLGAADIVIAVRNRFPLTRMLIESIYRYSDLPFHIYVTDNASTDETADLEKIYTRDITVSRNRTNRGWCSGVNQGIRRGSNPHVILMTNDVEISQGWLGGLISFLNSHPRIGAVGPLTSNPDAWQCVDRVRETLVSQIPFFLTEDHHERNRILSYHLQRAGILSEGNLGFFCTAMKRRAINEVGLLDESARGVTADENYCRRLRKAGYVLGLALDTYVVHHDTSTGALAQPLDEAREPSTDVEQALPAKMT